MALYPSQTDGAQCAGHSGSTIVRIVAEAERTLSDFSFTAGSRERLGTLAQRLAEQHLHVAVLGQFKRGKSTFLNALLGVDLLPTAVVPLTAVPIFVAYGETPSVRIHYRDDRPPEEHRAERGEELKARLFAVAAEEANPRNRLGVAHIEVFFPAPVLTGGTLLIDTPGIGSTHRHNTETALGILPECDAGLMVLSADPPITEVELGYLADVRAQVPRLHFVLNKVDYLTPEEREEAVEFLRRVLTDHLGEPPPIHCLSARRALAAKLAHDAQGVAASGLAAVEEQVIGSLAAEKVGLLERAVAGKAAAVLALAGSELSLAVAALRMPMDDLGQCLATFEELLPQFDRQRREAQDLLTGDRKRLAAALEDEADRLRVTASRHMSHVIAAAMADAPSQAEAAAREAVAAAIPVFFETELAKVSQAFTERVVAVFHPHRHRAVELIGSVRQAAADLFSIPPPAMEEMDGLELGRQPYWVTQNLVGSLIPLADGPLDFLLPRAKRLERLRRRLLDESMSLVMHNVENLRWSTLQNLDMAFRRFSGDLDRQLEQAVEATHGAIRAAFSRRGQEAGKIAGELDQIQDAIVTIDGLYAALQAAVIRTG